MFKNDYKSIGKMLESLNGDYTNEYFVQTDIRDKYKSQFNGDCDYTMATHLIKNGWEEGTKMLKKAKGNIKVPENKVTKRMPYGFYPIIPMAMIGNPRSMVYSKSEKTRKIINIFYDVGNTSMINSEHMLKAGALALTYVNELEKTGNVDINLYVQSVGESNGETLRTSVRVKDAGKAFSLRRVAFPMIHPAMHRIIMFRAREVNRNTTGGWYGYGRSVDPKKYSGNDFILPSAQTLKRYNYDFRKNSYEEYCDIVSRYNDDTKL